eukprot:RCo027358
MKQSSRRRLSSNAALRAFLPGAMPPAVGLLPSQQKELDDLLGSTLARPTASAPEGPTSSSSSITEASSPPPALSRKASAVVLAAFRQQLRGDPEGAPTTARKSARSSEASLLGNRAAGFAPPLTLTPSILGEDVSGSPPGRLPSPPSAVAGDMPAGQQQQAAVTTPGSLELRTTHRSGETSSTSRSLLRRLRPNLPSPPSGTATAQTPTASGSRASVVSPLGSRGAEPVAVAVPTAEPREPPPPAKVSLREQDWRRWTGTREALQGLPLRELQR